MLPWMCSPGSAHDFFEAAESEMLHRSSSGSESSATGQMNDLSLTEGISGIDLMLLTFSAEPGDHQLKLHWEKPYILGLKVSQILLRVSMLVGPDLSYHASTIP